MILHSQWRTREEDFREGDVHSSEDTYNRQGTGEDQPDRELLSHSVISSLQKDVKEEDS